MNRLLRETCLCLAVAALLLIGGAIVLLLTKAVEGFELIRRRSRVASARICISPFSW
jgi:hypothetical protein